MKITEELVRYCEDDKLVLDKPHKCKNFHIWVYGLDATLCGKPVDRNIRRWVIPSLADDVCEECLELLNSEE